MEEKVDILVLEDDTRLYSWFIRDQIPQDLTTKRMKNSQEFRRYMSGGGRAKLYFLDDRVPEHPQSDRESSGFNLNYECLVRLVPDAMVFCMDPSPDAQTEAYCSERGIPLVAKRDIGEVIEGELKLCDV